MTARNKMDIIIFATYSDDQFANLIDKIGEVFVPIDARRTF